MTWNWSHFVHIAKCSGFSNTWIVSLSRYAVISWRLTSMMPVNIFQISLAMWLIPTSGDDDSPDKCFVSDKKSSSEVEASPPLSPSTPFIRSYTGPNKTCSTLSSGSLDNKEAPGKLLRSSWSLFTILIGYNGLHWPMATHHAPQLSYDPMIKTLKLTFSHFFICKLGSSSSNDNLTVTSCELHFCVSWSWQRRGVFSHSAMDFK